MWRGGALSVCSWGHSLSGPQGRASTDAWILTVSLPQFHSLRTEKGSVAWIIKHAQSDVCHLHVSWKVKSLWQCISSCASVVAQLLCWFFSKGVYYLFIIFLLLCICVCWCGSTLRSQKKASDLLELELEALRAWSSVFWKPKLGPLQKQCVCTSNNWTLSL